jgi:endonuclease III
MIRPDDGIDCGAWSGLFSAADLTLPLDTHWIRMAPRLGLASRRTPGARMAREITAGLRRIAPSDPLRYDLPVCHLGIAGGCPVRLTAEDCAACRLRSICPTARARGSGLRRPAARSRRGAGARA